MNYEPLDLLPYIDEEISDLERSQIDQLIAEELTNQDTTKLHPSITPEVLSIPLIKDIQQIDNIDEFTLGGIDLSRYNDLTNEDILKTSMVYTYLKKQSSLLDLKFGKNQWLINNSQLKHSNDLIQEEISNKRQRINQLNEYRAIKQQEVKPMLDYLSNRWEESISKNVDLGIEILKLRLSQSESGKTLWVPNWAADNWQIQIKAIELALNIQKHGVHIQIHFQVHFQVHFQLTRLDWKCWRFSVFERQNGSSIVYLWSYQNIIYKFCVQLRYI